MGRKPVDLTGRRFGRLVVIERTGTKGGHAAWLCKCDCGNTCTVKSDHLRTGNTQSCGCFQRDRTAETDRIIHVKHGDSRCGARARLYSIWSGMKGRCHNSNDKDYHYYGGRGIKVCEEWLHDFAAFRDWALANGYDDALTIDRIDNDNGYSPDNCRWATITEQNRNKRKRTKTE